MTEFQLIAHCEAMIAREEELARQSPKAEATLAHESIVMLYRSQLAKLKREVQSETTAFA